LPELTTPRLFFELRDRGYQHGIAVLRRYVRQGQAAAQSQSLFCALKPILASRRKSTGGIFGHMRVGGAQRPVSAFSMVLSWSRAISSILLRPANGDLLSHAPPRPGIFGGVPRKIVYDNLKSVVLSHVGSVIQFNPRFLGVCRPLCLRAHRRPGPLSRIQGPCRGEHQVHPPFLLLWPLLCFIGRPARPGRQVARRHRQSANPRHHPRAPG